MIEQKGKLIKIESSHSLLRTDEVTGTFLDVPVVNNSFVIYSDSLDPDLNIRYVRTSTVQKVEWLYDKIVEFKTRNSTYRLEIE